MADVVLSSLGSWGGAAGLPSPVADEPLCTDSLHRGSADKLPGLQACQGIDPSAAVRASIARRRRENCCGHRADVYCTEYRPNCGLAPDVVDRHSASRRSTLYVLWVPPSFDITHEAWVPDLRTSSSISAQGMPGAVAWV